ncbi:MAG: laminin B domain-containing protein [Saprospiraceae bacterium]|nr:gliding motility-associated C-terminal domain-containing protein [Saprospiraceae bacterium]MDW8230539.1 laminin B domain-containing protein [Saprospiraceae bacterium]
MPARVNTFCTTVIVALLLSGGLPALAQHSTFDTDNEGWGAVGDPVSSVAIWIPTGGNPGGHIRVTDAATGDLWYFSAPLKFRGNKCGAYGRYLRWEQYASDTSQISPIGGRPDVVLIGGGLTLTYDLTYSPQKTWTPFEVLLREDAGWRLNNLNGPTPTPAEFRAALANISALRIRGEYFTGADFGGLDNVVLEDPFVLDLDADNSSRATDDGFAADTLCGPPYVLPIADDDLLVAFDKPIDSINLRLLLVKDAALERLQAIGVLPASLSLAPNGSAGWTLINNGNATAAHWMQALRQIRYRHDGPTPTGGERLVAVQAYGECGALGVRYAYLFIAQRGSAGLPGDTTLCTGGATIDLFRVLRGSPTPGGQWLPALPGGRFDPAIHPAGAYRYVAPAPANCAADTSTVNVRIEVGFSLGADTTLCHGEILRLSAPAYLTQWQWSTGDRTATLDIATAGQYALRGQTAYCTFADTVAVAFLACETCAFYAPNAFRPNGGGRNDAWQLFFPCTWQTFRLSIFDRWGNLVFQTDNPDTPWLGYVRDLPAPPGIYVWYAEWESDTPQGRRREQRSGDVLLVR